MRPFTSLNKGTRPEEAMYTPAYLHPNIYTPNFPKAQHMENRNINAIVDFFSTYCICDIPPQIVNDANENYEDSFHSNFKNKMAGSYSVMLPRRETFGQMHENGARYQKPFSDRGFYNQSKNMESIGMQAIDSESEWISTPPEYYNVKKANIAPMKDYNFETSYCHNKKTGRILRYFICKYDNCNRKFNKTWNFIDHVRIHTGEKPYKCSHCGKGFTQKGNYNKHLTLHVPAQN